MHVMGLSNGCDPASLHRTAWHDLNPPQAISYLQDTYNACEKEENKTAVEKEIVQA